MRAVVLALAVVAACSGCLGATKDPSTTEVGGPLGGGGDGFGSSVRDSELNTSYTFSGLLLCTQRAPVVLESVSAAKVSGPVQLEQVRLRTADPALGSLPHDAGTLPSSLSLPSGFKVTQSCATDNSTVSEMALQVRRTGSGDAVVDGLTITYRSGGKRYRTSYPYTALLCDAESQQADEHCR